MVEILNAIILGIVQGLTEFLPVSSSGHLELAKYILGDNALPEESLMMTVVLHFGTALATVFVFRKEIVEILIGFFSKGQNEEKSFAYKIVLSMIMITVVRKCQLKYFTGYGLIIGVGRVRYATYR
jgi:undecaprenyl-diphosphatase